MEWLRHTRGTDLVLGSGLGVVEVGWRPCSCMPSKIWFFSPSIFLEPSCSVHGCTGESSEEAGATDAQVPPKGLDLSGLGEGSGAGTYSRSVQVMLNVWWGLGHSCGFPRPWPWQPLFFLSFPPSCVLTPLTWGLPIMLNGISKTVKDCVWWG